MIEELFFELIKVSIGKRDCLSHTPSANEWSNLYDLAKKQSLVGVCFVGVQQLRAQEQYVPEKLYLTWMGMAAKIRQKNEVVNQQCVALQGRLAADGWRSCILKGQGNYLNYGSLSMLRQSGDIDIWLDGEMEDIVRYVNRIAPFDKINQQHVNLQIFAETEVEVHYCPSRFANRMTNRKLQRWFREARNAQMLNVIPFGSYGRIVVPTAEFNLVYQLVHIYRHLFNEGIGLRQLMDYFFVLRASNNEKKMGDGNWYRVWFITKDLGLDKFASALMWVMHKVFLLDMAEIPWTPNRFNGEFLLKEIIQMGNFGHSDERFRLNNKDSHMKRFFLFSRSKWRFIVHFPSEVFWEPIDMFFRFFEVRALRRKVLHLKQ